MYILGTAAVTWLLVNQIIPWEGLTKLEHKVTLHHPNKRVTGAIVLDIISLTVGVTRAVASGVSIVNTLQTAATVNNISALIAKALAQDKIISDYLHLAICRYKEVTCDYIVLNILLVCLH